MLQNFAQCSPQFLQFNARQPSRTRAADEFPRETGFRPHRCSPPRQQCLVQQCGLDRQFPASKQIRKLLRRRSSAAPLLDPRIHFPSYPISRNFENRASQIAADPQTAISRPLLSVSRACVCFRDWRLRRRHQQPSRHAQVHDPLRCNFAVFRRPQMRRGYRPVGLQLHDDVFSGAMDRREFVAPAILSLAWPAGVLNGSRCEPNHTSTIRSPRTRASTPRATVSTSGNSGIGLF